jgi:hypothetical protein
LRAISPLPALMGVLTADLPAGPQGRWDQSALLRAKFFGGALSSLPDLDVLAGANAFAVRNEAGLWEILQARAVRLTAPETYELSGLLRGLQGTERAMGALAGAPIVKLDARLVRIALRADEREAALTLFATERGRLLSDPLVGKTPVFWRDLHGRPFAPARVRARRLSNGDITLTWLRRARLGGDSWGAADPPLGEESESYRVEILDGASVKRAFDAPTPQALYALADQVADFGAAPVSLSVRVLQYSPTYGAGESAESTLLL